MTNKNRIKIAVLGEDLFHLDKPAIKDIVGKLHSEYKKDIEFLPPIVPLSNRQHFIPETTRGCKVLICRPLWGGQVTQKLIDQIREPGPKDERRPDFFLVTLSVATSPHIDEEVKKDGTIKIINSDGGNAEQTAELTLAIALILMRRVYIRRARFVAGLISDEKDPGVSRSLMGCTWTTLGGGNVARALLRKLCSVGVGKVNIWNRRMNLGYLENTLRDIEVISWISRSESKPVAVIGASGNGPSCIVEGFTGDTSGFSDAMRGTDIVSVHLEQTKETKEWLNKDKFKLIPDDAVLVNMGRHELINEIDLIDSLQSKDKGRKIAAYGTDVFPAGIEEGTDNVFIGKLCLLNTLRFFESLKDAESPLNRDLLNNILEDIKKEIGETIPQYDLNEKTNIFITPHIGGSTIDAEKNIMAEALGKLLINLKMTGTSRFTSFYTPPSKYKTFEEKEKERNAHASPKDLPADNKEDSQENKSLSIEESIEKLCLDINSDKGDTTLKIFYTKIQNFIKEFFYPSLNRDGGFSIAFSQSDNIIGEWVYTNSFRTIRSKYLAPDFSTTPKDSDCDKLIKLVDDFNENTDGAGVREIIYEATLLLFLIFFYRRIGWVWKCMCSNESNELNIALNNSLNDFEQIEIISDRFDQTSLDKGLGDSRGAQ